MKRNDKNEPMCLYGVPRPTTIKKTNEPVLDVSKSKNENKKLKMEHWIIFALIIALIIILVIGIKDIIQDIKYKEAINNVLTDDFEIEKKWLVNPAQIPYDLEKAEKIKIEQTYINFSPEIRVRKINDGAMYSFAVKTGLTEDGLIRKEIDEEITEEEYNNMVKKQEGNTIHKTRYQLLDGEYVLSIDIFSGDLEGLAYLEIEFKNKEEAEKYQTPDWVIKDVTADVRYKNGSLARFGVPED